MGQPVCFRLMTAAVEQEHLDEANSIHKQAGQFNSIQFKKSFVSPSLIEYPLREGPHSSLFIYLFLFASLF